MLPLLKQTGYLGKFLNKKSVRFFFSSSDVSTSCSPMLVRSETNYFPNSRAQKKAKIKYEGSKEMKNLKKMETKPK